MKHSRRFLFCSLLFSASMQAMACYTVHDRGGRVVYQGADAPVDMTRPLHETMPARFPGGHLTFDTTTTCTSIAATAPPARARAADSVLLTDQGTAQAMRLPYTPMAGGIAMVQPAAASRMAPGVTVVPAEPTALAAARTGRETVVTEYRAPNGAVVELVDRGTNPADATRMMGAGPAPRR